jgi:hypothetical protein
MWTSEPVPGCQFARLEVYRGQAGVRVDRADGSGGCLRAGGQVETYRRLTKRWSGSGGCEEDEEALLKSALFGTVAEKADADAFVAGAQPLLTHMRSANSMSVLEALSLIGLYLRAADDFQVSANFGYNRGLFYLLLGCELVPSWGPSWRNLIPDNRDSGDFRNGLPYALIIRVGHVLRARDRVHLELKLPQNNDSADEALFALDGLLVSSDACFDVIARVLNRYHAVGQDAGARWRSKKWVGKLLAQASELQGVVDGGTAFADAVALIGDLRSSLHGVPFHTVAYSEGLRSREVENLLILPPEVQTKVVEIVRRRGGDSYWGVRPDIDELVFVDLRSFVEALTRLVIEVIEAVVRAVIGPEGELDRRGDWRDTPEVRHQLRALSGTVGWNEQVGSG